MNRSLILVLFTSAVAFAQAYRGEAVPVVQRPDSVDFLRLRFLSFAFGREGPMEAPLTSPPVVGREYLVEADLFGIESIANVRFDLIGAGGRVLQPLTMWKSTDSVTDGEFYGFVTVPDQPFQAVVSGMTTAGVSFRQLLADSFQPAASGPPEQALLPPGIPATQANQVQAMVNGYRQEMRRRATRAAAEHPGGVITISRPSVSAIAYEPLPSGTGSSIGMRVRYSIRFSARQTITATPHVFPVYPASAWRGLVAMKPLAGTVSPPPQLEGAETLRDVIVYQAAATYQAGQTYNFTIDLTPDFVFQGSQSGRFCLHEQKFANNPVWNALIASQTPIPYSLTIGDIGTVANIPAFFPQRTFFESFKAGGAADCGPIPNIRF